MQRSGLVVHSEGELATKPGSRHWHLRLPGRNGTLELTEWRGQLSLKVAERRDGRWARDLALELQRRFARTDE